MSSSQLSRDLIHTLSCLVFACLSPDKSTLKLLDPVTGVLGDYLLVKLPSTVAVSPGPSQKLPPHAVLDDLAQRLKLAVLEDMFRDPPSKTMPSRTSTSRHSAPSKYAHGSTRGSPLARSSSTASRTCDVGDASPESNPVGPLAFLKRRLYYGENLDPHCTFSPLPPFPSRATSEHDTPSLLYDSRHPGTDNDTSVSSFGSLPSRQISPAVRSFPPHRANVERSYSSGNIGLGFPLLHDDGSLFDGNGPLPGFSDDAAPSPSDEARARACERRIRLTPLPSAENKPIASRHPAQTPKVVRFASSAQHLSADCAGPIHTSTPLNAGARTAPVTPRAPPRRVIGRLPVDLPKEKSNVNVDVKVVGRRASFLAKPQADAASESDTRTSKARCEEGKGVARLSHPTTLKRSPALGGSSTPAPAGEQLRYWSNWLTPVNEKEGKYKAAWRP